MLAPCPRPSARALSSAVAERREADCERAVVQPPRPSEPVPLQRGRLLALRLLLRLKAIHPLRKVDQGLTLSGEHPHYGLSVLVDPPDRVGTGPW